MIYVYTCILGGFDNLRPPLVRPEAGVRYICFTDVPMLPAVEPWEFRPVHRIQTDLIYDPARTSRVPKILPHLMLPEDAEYSIWHDGNFQLTQSPRVIINETLGSADWASYAHPGRSCIYKEAEILLKEKIGTPGLISAEIERYRKTESHPEGYGLWANGFIVRRHTRAVGALNESWWNRFCMGCERDQLSFPVARRANAVGICTACIPGDIYSSKYAKFSFHAAWPHRDDNHAYLIERAKVRSRVDRLRMRVGEGGYVWKEY